MGYLYDVKELNSGPPITNLPSGWRGGGGGGALSLCPPNYKSSSTLLPKKKKHITCSIVKNLILLFATSQDVLGKLLEPPSEESINDSIKRLHSIGALDTNEVPVTR